MLAGFLNPTSSTLTRSMGYLKVVFLTCGQINKLKNAVAKSKMEVNQLP